MFEYFNLLTISKIGFSFFTVRYITKNQSKPYTLLGLYNTDKGLYMHLLFMSFYIGISKCYKCGKYKADWRGTDVCVNEYCSNYGLHRRDK